MVLSITHNQNKTKNIPHMTFEIFINKNLILEGFTVGSSPEINNIYLSD